MWAIVQIGPASAEFARTLPTPGRMWLKSSRERSTSVKSRCRGHPGERAQRGVCGADDVGRRQTNCKRSRLGDHAPRFWLSALALRRPSARAPLGLPDEGPPQGLFGAPGSASHCLLCIHNALPAQLIAVVAFATQSVEEGASCDVRIPTVLCELLEAAALGGSWRRDGMVRMISAVRPAHHSLRLKVDARLAEARFVSRPRSLASAQSMSRTGLGNTARLAFGRVCGALSAGIVTSRRNGRQTHRPPGRRAEGHSCKVFHSFAVFAFCTPCWSAAMDLWRSGLGPSSAPPRKRAQS